MMSSLNDEKEGSDQKSIKRAQIYHDEDARMAGIKTYRGMRHRSGHKVRGQRLRSNGRKGSALGVQRKK